MTWFKISGICNKILFRLGLFGFYGGMFVMPICYIIILISNVYNLIKPDDNCSLVL